MADAGAEKEKVLLLRQRNKVLRTEAGMARSKVTFPESRQVGANNLREQFDP
jgi:hypothetical protein